MDPQSILALLGQQSLPQAQQPAAPVQPVGDLSLLGFPQQPSPPSLPLPGAVYSGESGPNIQPQSTGPTPVSQGSAQVPGTLGTKDKASVSTGSTGYSADKQQQVMRANESNDQRIQRQIDEKAARTTQQLGAQYDASLQNRTAANDIETQTAMKIADLKQAHDVDKAGILNQHYKEEQDALVKTQQEIHSNFADFKSSVAASAAMRVDPSQWYHEKSDWGKLGAIFAAGVGGALAQKTGNTSVISAMNKTIDDSIDAQVKNIQHGKDVAVMFKQVYDTSVQLGDHDAVTREKMRSMMLAHAEALFQAELDKSGSDLAKAAGLKNLADFQAARGKSENETFQLVSGQRLGEMQVAAKVRGDNLQASMESKRIAVEAEKNRLTKAGMDAKAAADKAELLVADTTQHVDPKTGKSLKGEVTHVARSKEGLAKIQEQLTANDNLDANLADVEQLWKKHGSHFVDYASLTRSDDGKELKAAIDRATSAYVLAMSGKAASDNERESLGAQIISSGWSSNVGGDSGGSKVLNRFRHDVGRKSETMVQQYAVPLTPEQRQAYNAAGYGSAGGRTYGAENQAQIDEKYDQLQNGTPTDTIDRAIQKAASPNDDAIATPNIVDSWKAYSKNAGYDMSKDENLDASDRRIARHQTIDTVEPAYAPHLDALYLAATDPNTPSDQKDKAVQAIKLVMASDRDPRKADYAQYLADTAGIPYDRDQLTAWRMGGKHAVDDYPKALLDTPGNAPTEAVEGTRTIDHYLINGGH